MNKLVNTIFLLSLTGLFGCGVYSFSGTTISPSVKTISVQQFYNDSDGGPPNMAQDFTDELRNYYQTNTSLAVTQFEGDLQIEGGIVGYRLTPVAPSSAGNNQQSDAAELTRLTITMQVSYVNTQDDQFDFDKSFSFYADYDNTIVTLDQVEDQLIDAIFDQIIQDIFNDSVANW